MYQIFDIQASWDEWILPYLIPIVVMLILIWIASIKPKKRKEGN